MYFPSKLIYPLWSKISTYNEKFLFYKISNLQKGEKDVRYCTA